MSSVRMRGRTSLPSRRGPLTLTLSPLSRGEG